MLKFREFLGRSLHQSWFVVFLCVGIVAGMILGLSLHINYFASPVWIGFVVAVFVLVYLKPKYMFAGLALVAGMVLAFFRVAGTLASEDYIRQQSGQYVASAEQTEPGNTVTEMRDWFAERITKLVPEPEVKLGLSYLLGMRTGLPNKLNEDLRAVGLVHIVVASGAHLSILVEVARKIFGRITRLAGLVLSVAFVIFFMAMVGWTPSILRAGVMTILTLLAWYVGRKIASWRIILMVMAFTLMLDPTFLTNLGWQLSFASYAGIMMLGPEMTKFFYGKREPGFIAGTIITTLAATLMTLPITLYYFGAVSLISVVANLLILPTLPYAMGLTFASGVVAGIPLVETVVGLATTKLLDYHIAVVGFFGEMKSFIVEMPTYQWQVFLIYGVILMWLGWKYARKNGIMKAIKRYRRKDL